MSLSGLLVAELPMAELLVAELPVAELPVAELPAAKLTVAELPNVEFHFSSLLQQLVGLPFSTRVLGAEG